MKLSSRSLMAALLVVSASAFAANPYGNYRLTNDTSEKIEPVVVRSTRSNPQGNGIDTTMYAWMKRISLGQYQINAMLTNGDMYVPAPGPLPLPSGYTTSGDPWVTANPNPTGTQPRSMYVAGTGQVHNGAGVTTNSIFVWRLSDGEIVWNRTAIATTDNSTDGFLDKPSITISTDSRNLGWTWVTYVKVPAFGGNPTIYLHRSIDGINYSQGVTPLSGAGYFSPIVVVDSTSGTVFVVWLSYADNKIYVAATDDAGFHWTTPVSFDAGSTTEPLLGPGTDLLCDNTNGLSGPCVIGRSMLSAKFNPYDRSIGVVWHRREPVGVGQQYNLTRTDVYFNSFSTTSFQWRGIHKVNSASSTNDQWNGALDVDNTGHYAVTWYDRRDDPNNRKYNVYAATLDQYGNRCQMYDVNVGPGSPTWGSDPYVYQPLSNNTILLGEYHGIHAYFDGDRWIWLSADIDIPWPYTEGDLWEDVVQP